MYQSCLFCRRPREKRLTKISDMTCTNKSGEKLTGTLIYLYLGIPTVWLEPFNQVYSSYFCLTKALGRRQVTKSIVYHSNELTTNQFVCHNKALTVLVTRKSISRWNMQISFCTVLNGPHYSHFYTYFKYLFFFCILILTISSSFVTTIFNIKIHKPVNLIRNTTYLSGYVTCWPPFPLSIFQTHNIVFVSNYINESSNHS